MLSRGFVSAISLFRGSQSRIFAAPVRNLSVLNSRSSLLRPSSFVVSRSMSNQETASGTHMPTMHHVTSLDKITLVLTRSMKPPIPGEVPTSTMERANSRRRIIINVTMGLLFLCGSITLIKIYQKGYKEHTLVSLHSKNEQRYEKLRDERAADTGDASGK